MVRSRPRRRLGKKPPIIKSIGRRPADFLAFRTEWFWDTDYDFSPEEINAMTRAQKEFLGFSDGAFACINRLPAHDTDLVMKKRPLRGELRRDSW